MEPFPNLKQVAIAIDGGGIKGLIVAKALEALEESLDQPLHRTFRLTAGTSTGSIIAAGIAAGMRAEEMTRLYKDRGPKIFGQSWRTRLWPLTRYRYPHGPLEDALKECLGETTTMGEFWSAERRSDVVITAFDLAENRTRFIKPWKHDYREFLVFKAVLASCSVPTYFPVVDGRWADGGIGGYSNPCFLAAYEICRWRELEPNPGDDYDPGFWDPSQKTTLISLGTGRSPHAMPPADRLWPWEWLSPLLGGFLQSADDQQVHLVTTFFRDCNLDFRRFQVELSEPIEMDDASDETLKRLEKYGEKLGEKILNDEFDTVQEDQEPFRAV